MWTLDARINARGFHIDRALAEAAQRIARSEQILIDGEIARLTNGTITTAGQVAKIAAFLRERGHSLENSDEAQRRQHPRK